jgi:hypothetical protein
MGKLLQISWPVVLLFLLTPAVGIAQGNDYCSLVVKLTDSTGGEDSSRQLIAVTEKNGRTTSMENRAGGVSFCDLGIMPVTIKVTKPYCHDITVNNVSLKFGETATIEILSYDGRCSSVPKASVDFAAPPWCTVLLRMKDDEDKWISGVTLKPTPPATDFTDIDPRHRANPFSQSDRAGRILVLIDLKGEFRAIAMRDGYMPETIQIPCTADTYYTERVVSMRKTSK